MNLFDILGDEIMSYIIIGFAAICIVFLILILVLFMKNRRLQRKYKAFMEGASGVSLEDSFVEKFDELYKLKNAVDEDKRHLESIERTLLKTYQKIAIVKYDAFKETGGQLSFVLAMLTDTNDGFLINSMHSSREGCYTYIKEVIKGEVAVVLSDEERETLDKAVGGKSIKS